MILFFCVLCSNDAGCIHLYMESNARNKRQIAGTNTKGLRNKLAVIPI